MLLFTSVFIGHQPSVTSNQSACVGQANRSQNLLCEFFALWVSTNRGAQSVPFHRESLSPTTTTRSHLRSSSPICPCPIIQLSWKEVKSGGKFAETTRGWLYRKWAVNIQCMETLTICTYFEPIWNEFQEIICNVCTSYSIQFFESKNTGSRAAALKTRILVKTVLTRIGPRGAPEFLGGGGWWMERVHQSLTHKSILPSRRFRFFR